jgi:methionyl-tRNA synthetase
MITIDDFHKVEIRVGQIMSAERVPDTEKLIKLTVDFGLKPTEPASPALVLEENPGEKDVRQIVSGIAEYFPDPEALVGKKCAFVANLEPRNIKGFESQGMIMAAGDGKHFSLFEVSSDVLPGTIAK